MINTFTDALYTLRGIALQKRMEYKQLVVDYIIHTPPDIACILCFRPLNLQRYTKNSRFFWRKTSPIAIIPSVSEMLVTCAVLGPLARFYNGIFSNGENTTFEPLQKRCRRAVCDRCMQILHSYPASLMKVHSGFTGMIHSAAFYSTTPRTDNEMTVAAASAVQDPRDDVKQITQGLDRRKAQAEIRRLRKKHIAYKIDVLLEQLDINSQNYNKAMEYSQFQDAESFKKIQD